MSKTIITGHEARLRVSAGMDKAFLAVAPTLGAVGMTAIIEYAGLDPIECDDGVTILKNLEFKDRYENMGVQMLRKAAIRTSNEGGDGTATTTVLTHALKNEALKEIANDSYKIREVRERLQEGLKETLEALSNLKRGVSEDDIEKIAAISSLDPEVATLIAEIIKEVGVNGVVTVEKGAKLGYTSEVVKGARFDKGLISPFFINDHENKQTVLNDPYIVLVDRKISTNEQILSLINSIGTGNDILFIADDVDSVALGTLALNAQQGRANIACVRNPYSASAARDFLFDMAALTGGTVISEEMGMKLDEQTKDVCGRAEKVIVNQHTTTIVSGKGDAETRIRAIQGELEGTTSEYAKKMLEDRLAALTGGIGVIRVGAYTDTEFNAKKYKFENAINATQAALQEGILPGGGVALARASRTVSEPMFRKALETPFRQMAINAGMFDKTWFGRKTNKLLEVASTQDGYVQEYNKGEYVRSYIDPVGYDFKTKTKVEMFKTGIIDPFKVTRLALESATAIASSLISIETAIVTEGEPMDGKE